MRSARFDVRTSYLATLLVDAKDRWSMLTPRLVWIAILAGLPSVACSQQTITISWPSKQLLSQAITVNGNTPVTVTLQNVNDLLYTYEVTLVATPMPTPTILTGAATAKTPAAVPTECVVPQQQLNSITGAFTAWQLDPWLDSTNKPTLKAPASVALTTTSTYFQADIQTPLTAVGSLLGNAAPLCTDPALRQTYANLVTISNTWLAKLSGSHSASISAVLEPLNNYTIHIREYSIGSPTHSPTLTNACTDSTGAATDCLIQYQPKTDIISISGGFLFSELQARTYARGSSPNSTDSVLAVNGNSMSSLLAALVNVKLPCVWVTCSAKDNAYGLAVSIGPVYSLNGTDVSKVGLFGGLSLSLWKYLYLTAGTHVGQFADFPPGFTHAGQDIPASFTGALTPVGRTSARFAFGVTFKGFSIPTSVPTSMGQFTTSSGTK